MVGGATRISSGPNAMDLSAESLHSRARQFLRCSVVDCATGTPHHHRTKSATRTACFCCRCNSNVSAEFCEEGADGGDSRPASMARWGARLTLHRTEPPLPCG